MATRAHRYSRHFLNKVSQVSPDLFEHYTLTKFMSLDLHSHLSGLSCIPTLPRSCPDKHIRD